MAGSIIISAVVAGAKGIPIVRCIWIPTEVSVLAPTFGKIALTDFAHQPIPIPMLKAMRIKTIGGRREYEAGSIGKTGPGRIVAIRAAAASGGYGGAGCWPVCR